jgi:hypothetical protein
LASSDNSTCYVEVWTSADRDLGTKLGDSSDIQTVTSSGYGNIEIFTFAINKPTPTGDYFIHVIRNSGSSLILIYRTTPYEDSSYTYFNGDNGNNNSSHDLNFGVNYN